MNASNLKVGILSPGDMGGGTGAVLHKNGVEVYTCLAGRSDLTKQIAAEAGFRDTVSLDELVSTVDILLSILVPSAATELADDVAAALKRTGASLTYVDCNAIAPQTVTAIEKIIRGAGADFVDAGIIGGPPDRDSSSHIACSGPNTRAVEELGKRGLTIKVIGSEIGQASGLKMVYAASTKGTTALWTELFTAARAMGLQDALLAEFGKGNPIAERQMNVLPAMPHRAHRWIGEMEEIAATFEGLGLTPLMLEGAAEFYRYVNSTPLGRLTSRDPHPAHDDVLETLSANLEPEGSRTGAS